jgi:3-oxoacid CoA-transferase subunit A
VELELVPQGTLAERIGQGSRYCRFYTPTGPGTVIEEGKERYFNGRPHLLEYALKANYALIRAYKADETGNLIFRGTQRQFNPVMAMGADNTIAEVDEIVKPGEIDPNAVVVPGPYVKRIIQVTKNPGFPRHLETTFQVKEEVK